MRRVTLCFLLAIFAVASSTHALGTNVLVNPDFNTSTDNWNVTGFEVPSPDDADECAASDSLGILPQITPALASARQCVNLPSGPTGRARFRARLAVGSTAVASIAMNFYSNAGCSGELISSTGTGTTPLVNGTWVEIASVAVAMTGATVGVQYIVTSGTDNFVVELDRMFFGSSTEIFVEDNEIGEACRYGSSAP